MSYDLHITAPELSTDPSHRWTKRLNACDRMEYEFHPSVKFEVGRAGFWPIKVTTPRRRLFSSRKSYISGFEMFLSDFSFESYFDCELEDDEGKKRKIAAEGFDFDLWQNFRLQVSISFKPYNAFEATLSFLSAAILTEELNGLCHDPQTGQYFGKRDVFEWAKMQAERNNQGTSKNELVAYPFEGWQ
ncbi:hypothetical protein [Alterisphingorhabdus coralli]|uniref:Uncharacterized protein n=1 Tax=Alterisphingorhabdus coralli TaxID=3071408 RepID=A0AA97HZC3_9SPHN|nr:hypothetical protein [Parasphingorhabdus sp. SCSIO 66989]WOE74479.1 hypothetical protein RB602_11555 [Parasphingorhabdus sp. SCSIO 66989]